MNVVITDVRREPAHDRARLHEARRFHGGLFVGPASLGVEGDVREIMLRVEEISSDRVGDEIRDGLREHESVPSAKDHQRRANGRVEQQRDQAIEVPPWIAEERMNAHPVDKRENVAAQDGERVPGEEVSETARSG